MGHGSGQGGQRTFEVQPIGMAKLTPGAACSAVLLTACAHPNDARLMMPTTTEISGYVAEHWTADFNARFSRFAGQPGQSSELVSVSNARCQPSFGGEIAECYYVVTALFSGGEGVTRELWSQFERNDDGSLNEVLIVWHERRR